MILKKGVIIGVLLAISCSKDAPQQPATPVTITYKESQEDFPNPERGFYRYSETRASSYSPLSESVLKSYRTPKTASGASYSVFSTLVFRYFVLDAFKSTSLSNSFINSVRTDLTTARNAGVKLIVRFTYTVDVTAGACSEGFICPPYGDAPKSVVLGHISQLKSLFQDNADVIACVQMGFVGTWGEQYYTDYFGDASSNGQSKLLDANWQDRIDVLKALLDATPKDIMIQVRYPQIKQRYIYGINAPVTSAALTEAEAFSETDKARIAYHNDCFLASSDDYGTYEDYGNSSTPRLSANATLRAYFAADSKYLVVGGETCTNGYSPQNNCAPAGMAEKEMADMHYSFLNTDYNNQLNNNWVTGGCMDNIKKKLGYRFVLKSGTYTSSLAVGEKLSVSIELQNIGYASPYKARPVQLILKNKGTQAIIVQEFATDIRKWFTGTLKLTGDFTINAAAGQWDLYLNLPDKYASINKRFEYSIRLANENVWDEATGYNNLNHTVIVK
ncbi:MAG: DUF4832 domain-containing protein [Chitinophagaceae bacterium]|nr:DUF4832 domain-containing protein [Chitinophagaceae bacterium]